MSKGKTITEGKTHYIAEILDDFGKSLGYAVFDLDGKQVSDVMSLNNRGQSAPAQTGKW